MSKTMIEWTDETWNPVTGCSKVSQGCKNCYACRDWQRLAANRKTVYYGREFTDVRCHPERLDQPLRWRKPRRVFVNSMSDLFHEDVPDDFIDEVFGVMGACDDLGAGHRFQILTKRPEKMLGYMKERAHKAYNRRRMDCNQFPPRCVWLGVSIEDQATADERIPILLETPAAMRFVSAEPLIGEVNLQYIKIACPNSKSDCCGDQAYDDVLNGTTHCYATLPEAYTGSKIDWLIVGGESGLQARPMHPDWVRSLRDQCQEAGVPFFFKQWGVWLPGTIYDDGTMLIADGSGSRFANYMAKGFPDGEYFAVKAGKKRAGRMLDGRTWEEFPG